MDASAGALWSEPHLDRVLERFSEGPRARYDGLVRYQFEADAGSIAVTADDVAEGGTAAWWIHADSEEALGGIAAKLTDVGNLRHLLEADTRAARWVLNSVL